MNWLDVISSLLAFLIFLFFLTTLLYFVQYQMQKKQRLKAQFVHPLEGRFLLRYVPLELKGKYEAQIENQKQEIEKKSKRWWFQGTAVLFFCLVSIRGAGQELVGHDAPIFSSMIESDATSDDVEKNSFFLSYRNHRRDPLWPYRDEAANGWDVGVNAEHHEGQMGPNGGFSGSKVGLTGGYKFSNRYYLEVGAAVHQLESNRNDVDTTRLVGSVRGVANPLASTWISLSARNDLVYQELFLPAGVTQGLTATTARMDVIFRPNEKWRVLAKTSQKWFSDGNRREDHDAAVMYGVAPTDPWIWVGIGASYLGYQFSQPGLWTPHHFVAYGPRIDSAVTIRGRFTAIAEFNYNLSKEENLDSSAGYSVAAGLRYGDRNELQITALFRRIETDLREDGWSSRGGMLTASYSF